MRKFLSRSRKYWQAYYFIVLCLSGLEQSKARGDEADKDMDNEDSSSVKDQLIKRKFPAMLGQAISVVGGYKDKASEATPAIRKPPEPILPVAQTKWAHSQHCAASAVARVRLLLIHFDLWLLQDSWAEWKEKSVSPVRRSAASLRPAERNNDLQGCQTHPAFRESHCPKWHVTCKSWPMIFSAKYFTNTVNTWAGGGGLGQEDCCLPKPAPVKLLKMNIWHIWTYKFSFIFFFY